MTGTSPSDHKSQHRTIFISDVHLGTRGCKAEDLIDFLRHNDSETLYLVGDIVDGWRLKRAWFWNDFHNDVVQEILRKARNGTRVIYVPGNHDEALRPYVGHDFGGVALRTDDIHLSADGKRYLVVHGDHYDSFVQYGRWMCLIGDWAYGSALRLNDFFNWMRRRFGRGYWSLSGYLKVRLKNAARFIQNYEMALAREAARRDLDGVICGHIHHAAIRPIEGVLYCNSGDWVESCTALIEDRDGRFRIVHWTRDAMKPGMGGQAQAA